MKKHIAIALSTLFLSVAVAAAQPNPAASPKPSPITSLSNKEREELDRLRDEKQIQKAVEQVETKLETSTTIRDLIQSEVDRAFSRTTNLINILLFFLTLFPLAAAVVLFLLRSSIISQIVAETKNQLESTVQKQLEEEVADEFRGQTEVFKHEMERLQAEFVSRLSHLQTLVLDAQQQKDKIIQELSHLIPSSLQETISPEVQHKIQELSQQLKDLQAASSQIIVMTAEDCVKEGDALFFLNRYDEAITYYDKALESKQDDPDIWFLRGFVLQKLQRYEEAIASYDKTIQIIPDDMDYWYYRACCYALQGQLELAIENMEWAIHLNPRCIKWAKTNADFDKIWQEERFKQLIEK